MSLGLRARSFRAALLALTLLGPAAPAIAQSSLDLIQRFGPDGLPFTYDDPLAVGADASEYRYTAMAADTCSEEQSLAAGLKSAHGHGVHPSDANLQTPNLGHTAGPAAGDLLTKPVTQKPFDFTGWVAAVNLADGKVRRWRLYPNDAAGWGPVELTVDRGWGATGWDAKETSGNNDLNKLWPSGGAAKNLHLEAVGLGMRDVKPKVVSVGMGIPVGVKHETLKMFPQFPESMEGGRIDMFAQQEYIEAWVLELMSLDTGEAAISGNFVADLAGLQIATTLRNVSITKKVNAPILGEIECTATFDNAYIEVGGPAGFFTGTNTLPPSTFVKVTQYPGSGKLIIDQIADEVASNMTLSGGPLGACGLGNLFKDKVREEVKKKVDESMKKLDDVALLAELDVDGEAILDAVRKYSGLADRTTKNPFDRVAMGAMVRLGQFKPDRWLTWKMTGDVPAAMSFSLDKMGIDPHTVKEVIEEGKTGAWRYNFGSTYLGKSGRLFGNSAGVDDKAGPAEISEDARRMVPDVLESYAKKWVYLDMDVIDPYALPEATHHARWSGVDLLFPKGPRPPIEVDWPPQNYGFGKAQIVSMRSGSGGDHVTFDPAPDVDPASAMQGSFLVAIDPGSRTWSTCGTVFTKGSQIGNPSRYGAAFGWGTPKELPAGLDPAANGSDLRWFTAGANHYVEAGTQLRWMWDFQNDGSIETEHCQHLSSGGGDNFGAAHFGTVFAYQPAATDGTKGRTGMAVVPMNKAARDLLKP